LWRYGKRTPKGWVAVETQVGAVSVGGRDDLMEHPLGKKTSARLKHGRLTAPGALHQQADRYLGVWLVEVACAPSLDHKRDLEFDPGERQEQGVEEVLLELEVRWLGSRLL
jgi:hypothetical protein